MRREWLLAALGLSTVTACSVDRRAGSDTADPQGPQTQAVPSRAKTPDLDKLLKAVSERPVPQKLSGGAMCYSMVAPPDRVEYVCPTCGAKTLHSLRKAGLGYQALSIREYRSYVDQLKQIGLDIRLDESCLCSACTKESAKTLALEVAYKGKKTRSGLRDIDDLRILLAFVKGRLVWKGEQDDEHALKPELPRICELLGINPPE